MRTSRGFTLIELMVSAVMATILAAAALSAVSTLQTVTGAQAQGAATAAAGRVAMDVMGRDLRNAGDSLVFLPPCLPIQHPQATFNCPAILEPHPWRVILARNAWVDANGDGSTYSIGDSVPDIVNKPINFNQDGNNIVAYEFVPDGAATVPMVDFSGPVASARNVWLGHIERIQNPFAFGGQPAVRSVLASNVILDNAMVTDPINNQPNADYSWSLFMYSVASQTGELVGNPNIVARASPVLVSPPLRFFPIGPPTPFAAIPAAQPFAGSYPAEIMGLSGAPGTPQPTLFADDVATNSVPGVDLWTANSELRRILDRDRIRSIHVAFRLYGARNGPAAANPGLPVEDPNFHMGLDVDGNPANGTAHIYTFRTSFELKALTSMSGTELL